MLWEEYMSARDACPNINENVGGLVIDQALRLLLVDTENNPDMGRKIAQALQQDSASQHNPSRTLKGLQALATGFQQAAAIWQRNVQSGALKMGNWPNHPDSDKFNMD